MTKRVWTLKIYDDYGNDVRQFSVRPTAKQIDEELDCWSTAYDDDTREAWETITVTWELVSPSGKIVSDGAKQFKYEPDHCVLIERAAAMAGLSLDNICGIGPDDHEWCGVGGCRENPGVFSDGGTRMHYVHKCSKCGLYRDMRDPGCQTNKYEYATVRYFFCDDN